MARKPAGQAKEIIEELVKFETVGTRVEGELVSMEKDVHTKLGENTVYRLEDERGALLTIFGTAVLRRKLSNVKLGDWVDIELLEIVKDATGTKTLKQFKVCVIAGTALAEPDGADPDKA